MPLARRPSPRTPRKVDKKDINRIAAALAGDAGDLDVDPVLAAKLQMPKFRCLSCNRPLRGTGTKASDSGVIFQDSQADDENGVSVTPVTKAAPLAEVKAPPGYRAATAPEDDAGSPYTHGDRSQQSGFGGSAPRLPPPNRVRTAVGGGGAGLSARVDLRTKPR